MADIPIEFQAAPRFDKVRSVFRDSFKQGLEQGVQFAVFQDGEPLIDAIGGWADRRKTEPVTHRSLFSIYSSGKAMAALVIAWLVETGQVDYDQSVISLWPEFAAHGKDRLTVAQILSHQHGLPGIVDPEWTAQDWYDWDKTIAALAAQSPLFEPGSACAYSPITYGFLVDEIARRADKANRHLGEILRSEICDANDLDIWIGLPETEHGRVVDMLKPRALAELGEINAETRAAFMTKAGSPGGRPHVDWLTAEFAGSNCQATAQSLARAMQMAVNGYIGEDRILSDDTIAAFQQVRISGQNRVLPFETTYAAGLLVNAPNFIYGPNPDTLGHSGWGGSCVFADPASGIHGAYVMNKQGNSLIGDERPVQLINALYECL